MEHELSSAGSGVLVLEAASEDDEDDEEAPPQEIHEERPVPVPASAPKKGIDEYEDTSPRGSVGGRVRRAGGSDAVGSSRYSAKEYPPLLDFLALPECNPDFTDEKQKKIGFVEAVQDPSEIAAELTETGNNMTTSDFYHQDDTLYHAGSIDGIGGITGIRGRVGRVANSTPVLLLVGVTIIFDMAVLIKNFAEEKDAEDYSDFDLAADLIVLIILGLEVFARLIWKGKKFFKGKTGALNVFELLLVPATLVEIALQHARIPVSVLRILRPLFRGLRVMRIIVRSFGRGKAFKQRVRRRVAGHRLRYTKNGFDLDLAYIGKGKDKQVIATSLPAVGYEALFRNAMPDLARFLNERHTNRYLLVNLTEERRYPLEPFFNRYLEVPITQNGVPSLKQTWEFCELMHGFLQMDPSHVVCVHSKNGRGRVGLMVCAYFLYLGTFSSAATAIAFFERCRVNEDMRKRHEEAAVAHPKSVDTPSQARFLEYFFKLMKAKHRFGRERVNDILNSPRRVNLQSATIHGLPGAFMKGLDLKFFPHSLGPASGIKRDVVDAISPLGSMRNNADRFGDERDIRRDTGGSAGGMKSVSVKLGLGKLSNGTSTRSVGRQDGYIMQLSGGGRREEARVPHPRSARHQALMAHIQAELEASCYDTVQSGGYPEEGPSILQTIADAQQQQQQQQQQLELGDRPEGFVGVVSRDVLDEAVTFSFAGVQVTGELKVELHCKASLVRHTDTRHSGLSTGNSGGWRQRLGAWLGHFRGSKIDPFWWVTGEDEDEDGAEGDANAKNQMLVSFWLHTDFLERHSTMSAVDTKDLPRTLNDATSVQVVFRRFDMDKAAGAPKLWSYSTSFEVQLEFEYEFNEAGKEDLDEEFLDEGDPSCLTEFDSVPALKMSWVNWCIRHVWHHCEGALRNMLLEIIMPMLNEFIPGALRPVSLKDFSLGSEYPVLGPMIIASKSGRDAELQMDCVLNWDGDVTALLDVGGYAEVGVSRVTVRGVIALKLKPFIDHIPIIGGMEVFFLNPPHIDLKFAGDLQLANISILRPAILQAVKDALTKKLVLPNVIQVDIQPESRRRGDPMIRFKDVDPIGILRIRVMEAMRLRGADWSLWSRTRTSDPYCILQIGSTKVSTRIIEKTTEPVWNESFDILLHDWKQCLEVSIFDYDFGKADDLLGKVKALPILTLLAASVQGLWMPLVEVPQDNSNDGPIGSQLLLSAEAFQFNTSSEDFDHLKEEIRRMGNATVVLESVESGPERQGSSWMSCGAPDKCVPCSDGPTTMRTAHLLDRDVEIDSEERSAVALFSFRIKAAQIPQALVPHTTDAVIQVSCGKALVSRNVTPRKYSTHSTVSSEVQKIIESLAKSRLNSREIREILNEDGVTVQRLIEKGQGFNAEIATRMHLLVTLEDLAQAKEKLQFSVKLRNNIVATGTMPLTHFGHASTLQVSMLVKCHPTHRDRESAALDVEASLAILGPHDLDHIRDMAEQVAEEQHHPLWARMSKMGGASSRLGTTSGALQGQSDPQGSQSPGQQAQPSPSAGSRRWRRSETASPRRLGQAGGPRVASKDEQQQQGQSRSRASGRPWSLKVPWGGHSDADASGSQAAPNVLAPEAVNLQGVSLGASP